MSVDEIYTRTISIIREALGIAEGAIEPGSSFRDDLGADSLSVVEVVMALEESFKVEFTDAAVDKMRTVSDVIDYLTERLSVDAREESPA